jgi:capsid protein
MKMTRRIQLDHQQQGRYTQLGYRTVRAADRDGLRFSAASGDRHMQNDRLALINQSRDFWRNNPIYKGMIDRAVSYIIGDGFKLQVKTPSPAVNTKLEKLWKDFWIRPEIRNLQTGKMLEKLLCREAILCGDCGVIKTNKAVLQAVEAEQIAGKDKLLSGIEQNGYGTPTAFWVCRYGAFGKIDKRTARRIEARDFLYIANIDRPSSSRGVPAAQAAFPMLHRINDVCDSEAVAWQILSKLAVSVIREGGPELAYAQSGADPSASGNDTDLTTRLTELDYALMFHGNPGETVQGIDRNIPGQNFPESLRMFLRLLGLPLGLPLELVLLDWTRSNYSQSRAVLEQAYQTFLDWQDLHEGFLLSPVFEWKLAQWTEQRLIGQREIPYGWIRPTFPWIDQLKEAEAKGHMVDRSFMTHAQVCKSLGMDREELVESRRLEVRSAIETAQQIEQETGQKVPWEIFAGLVPGADKTAPEKTNAPDEPTDGKDES